MAHVSLKAELASRDSLELSLTVSKQGDVEQASLKAVGCLAMLKLVEQWRPLLRGPLTQLPVPTGVDHASILLRELIWRAQGKWQPPYQEVEMCHCRAVPTHVVDQAIVAGAHTPEQVSRQTSASTNCGTCRPDVQMLIAYRLQSS